MPVTSSAIHRPHRSTALSAISALTTLTALTLNEPHIPHKRLYLTLSAPSPFPHLPTTLTSRAPLHRGTLVPSGEDERYIGHIGYVAPCAEERSCRQERTRKRRHSSCSHRSPTVSNGIITAL